MTSPLGKMSEKMVEDEASFIFGLQLASASVLPNVLKVALELDLLELMKKKAPDAFISPAELAAEISTNNPEAHDMVDRILRVLASHSVLNCRLKTMPSGGVERLYSLTPVSKFFIKNDDGVSLAPYLMMNLGRVHSETWYHLKDAILEGGYAFEKAYKMNGFEYQSTDPIYNNVFNSALSNVSTIWMKKIVHTYKGFEGLKTLVDVGGGIGASLHMIISKHPTIKGINYDLPHVIRDAPSYVGVEHMGGNMFVSVPKADAIFLKWVLHDWNDTESLKILKNCYEALPKNGKVIIAEFVLSENPSSNNSSNIDDTAGTVADVMMLAISPGGRERTLPQYEALANEAGFTKIFKICNVCTIWIMELHK